ncbi:hypothetical protein JCM10207_006105 [Rhodosporidiobolus poonsookiae]
MPDMLLGLLNKAILVSASVLMGAFFTNWIVDHPLIWEGPAPADEAVASALRYYAFIFHAPPFYVSTLTALAVIALVAAAIKLVLSPLSSKLFDGAILLLVLSSITVYTSNVLAALRYLPLSHFTAGASASEALQKSGLASALDSLGQVRLVEALQSLASSHMILAVSLTGVLALQGAHGYAERDSAPPAGVVPPTETAPVPVHGEKVPEKGLHPT